MLIWIFAASPPIRPFWRTGDADRPSQPRSFFPPLARFFFVLSSISRAGLAIGLLERPLAIALLWTLTTGEASVALPLGVFFELFWIDQIPIGSFQPPNGVFPFMMVMLLARRFSWNTPEQLIIPALYCLCFAYITPAVESWLRPRRARLHSIILHNARRPESLDKALRPILAFSAMQFIGLDVLFFIIATTLTGLAFHYIYIHAGLLAVENTGWSFLLSIGAVGALLSLRVKRSYIAFCVSGLAAMTAMTLWLVG